MKNTISILIIFLSTFCYSQNDDVKEKIKDLNELYGKRKYQKVEILSKEILNNKFGTPTNEDKSNVLTLYTALLIWDDYENKNYKLGYDYILDLLDLWKNGMNDFPLKESNVLQINNLIKDLENKHPELINSKKETPSLVTKSTDANINSSSSPTDSNKTVTLTVSGTGKTLEEAKLNALRSAIEQAFGAFISSKTEILNDNLIKDEIISVSNGSIQKFNIVSEVEIPNTGFATTLNATVSVSKLTTFVESKGVVAEFKGSLFSFNIKQQILNENNEVKAINDLCETAKQIFDKSVDYQIAPENPIALDNTNQNWSINLNIGMSINNNILSIADYMYKTLNDISMSKADVYNYKNLGKMTYPISFASDKKSFSYINLRKEESLKLLINLIKYFDKSAVDFNVLNGNSTINMKDKFPDFTAISDLLILLGKEYSDEIPESSTFYNQQNEYLITNIKNHNAVFTNQFTFITKLLMNYEYKTKTERVLDDKRVYENGIRVPSFYEIKVYNPGTIISFLQFRTPTGSASLQYVDKRTLDEINKITEYKISKK